MTKSILMNPPYRKINLLSRKAKDEKGLASIKNGGDYVIRSKNKISNPTNPSQTLSRGSKVSVRTKSDLITKSSTSPTTYKSATIDVPKSKFVPGDMQKDVKDRPTTMALGKQLREDPKKTATRMDAQSKGKISYAGGGKEEYSGRIQKSYEPRKINVPVPGKTIVSKEKVITPVTTVKSPASQKENSKGVSFAVRRVAGVNNQGKGQNYKRLDIGLGKKTIKLAKWKTPTRNTQ